MRITNFPNEEEVHGDFLHCYHLHVDRHFEQTFEGMMPQRHDGRNWAPRLPDPDRIFVLLLFVTVLAAYA
jgi:hypothetical protein